MSTKVLRVSVLLSSTCFLIHHERRRRQKRRGLLLLSEDRGLSEALLEIFLKGL
jgi:hypothetical protein